MIVANKVEATLRGQTCRVVVEIIRVQTLRKVLVCLEDRALRLSLSDI